MKMPLYFINRVISLLDWQRMAERGKAVVLLTESAVSMGSHVDYESLPDNLDVFLLRDSLNIVGIDESGLHAWCQLVDFSGFVALTVRHEVIVHV